VTETPSLWCAICERPIRGRIRGEDAREDVREGVLLCPKCAANPVLVDAFREGRARLAEENAA
jgi:hypothetical protein